MFRRGIVSSFGKRVAPKDAPCAAEDAGDHAEIVDRPLGVFRTRRRIEAGVAGEIFLIEADDKDTECLEVRFKDRSFQILPVGPYEPRCPYLQAVFPSSICR